VFVFSADASLSRAAVRIVNELFVKHLLLSSELSDDDSLFQQQRC